MRVRRSDIDDARLWAFRSGNSGLRLLLELLCHRGHSNVFVARSPIPGLCASCTTWR